MSWITGSRGGANTHLTLVTDLMNAATGNGATAVAIQAGGTGYTVGDIVTVSGGTSTFPCKLRVTAVSGTVVTGVVVAEGGSYSSNPTNPVAVTGPGNDDATFNLTMASNGWTLKRRSVQAASAVQNNNGTGGTNGAQVVTVVGGVGVTTAAQFNVTITGGSISAVNSVATVGLYELPPNLSPPSLVSTAVPVTGAGLSGATLDITWAYPTTQEQVMILQGTGGGSDAIIVGLRTYSASNAVFGGTARNWALYGFTAYNAGLTFDSQAGKSPGDPTVATNDTGAFVPLHDNGASFPIDFWFSVTPNRIVAAFQLQSATTNFYASMYLGFLNRFGSPSEWPYPIYVSGCTTRVRALHDSTVITYVNSIVELISTGTTDGPAWYRRSDGTWQPILNSTVTADETSPARSLSSVRVLFPVGAPNPDLMEIDDDDEVTDQPTAANGGFVFSQPSSGATVFDVIATTGVPGAADKTLHPTPNTGASLRRLYPCTVILSQTGPPAEQDVLGELDGVFWVSASDVTTPLTSEDFVDVGTDRHRVFQSGSRALDYTYFALREK